MTDYVTTNMLTEENKRLGRYPRTRDEVYNIIRHNAGKEEFKPCVKRIGRIYLINPVALNEFISQQNIN